MISYVKIKPTADKAKNWVKGVCTSDDTKPIDGIANGSKLLELDTGKKCVYDEGQTKWIEYGTGEDRSGGDTKVTTETISGPLSTIFSDNGWDETKFNSWAILMAENKATLSAYVPELHGTLSASALSDSNQNAMQFSVYMRGSTLLAIYRFVNGNLDVEVTLNGDPITDQVIAKLFGISSFTFTFRKFEEE